MKKRLSGLWIGCRGISTVGAVDQQIHINGMKRLWGRKDSALGLAQFMPILGWVRVSMRPSSVASKRVVKISRWQPTIQRCSGYEQKHKLALQDRQLHCDWGLVIDRDHSAAKHSLEAGYPASKANPSWMGRHP